MSETDALERVHAMYVRRLPQASATWDWLKKIEFVANARSPLVEAVQSLRAQGIVPVCNFMQALPGDQYKIILTRAQLEHVIAEHYHIEKKT